jgi:ABC-type lipoprotein export system ATPase subunit
MALITQLNGAGQTVVMVMHNPKLATATARTVRMRDGRLEDDGYEQLRRPVHGAALAVRAHGVGSGSP